MPSTARLLATALLAIAYACGAPGAGAELPLPPPLASMHEFRGKVDYIVRRDGSGIAVDGTLVVGANGWSLDERTKTFDLQADQTSARLRASTGTDAAVADLIDSDIISNVWAPLLGTLADSSVGAGTGTGMWDAGALHVFLDPSGAQVIGLRENGPDDVAYTLDDWWPVGSLEVPHRILRLRGGLPTASYSITDYAVIPYANAAPRAAQPFVPAMPQLSGGPAGVFGAAPPVDIGFAQRAAAIAFSLLVLALGLVAWTRRDALIVAWCARAARDPRGWRTAGVSIFVEPDGTLSLDGSRYRVGAAFYNRAVLVQRSALFIRITTPAVPHAVVLPRRFTKVELGLRPSGGRTTVAGFTLIETMVATALFAAVILLAVYPAIAAVAHADSIAAQRTRAAVIASNALSDEEIASAYGGVSPGSTTTSVDGLVVTVTISPGTIRDESDLDVVVADENGHALAHVVSWLGVGVTAPPGSNGGPPRR